LQGGSAYLFVGRNKIHDCGTTGFGAGQSTGLQYMTPPWFHYECMDVKFVNNVLHDIDGAGFGVWGAYNILMAHNTLYRVGRRSHTIEIIFGFRTCDNDGISYKCAAYVADGAWGPSRVTVDESTVSASRDLDRMGRVRLNQRSGLCPDVAPDVAR